MPSDVLFPANRPLNVAYLGPKGTFSYFTAKAALPGLRLLPAGDIPGLFAALKEEGPNHADLALVPLENSLRGTVGQSFDLLLEHNARILAELYSHITNCLMSREPDLASIKAVYSHPQPLAQCSRWLRDHLPGAALIAMESTAAAGRRAADEPGAAALGHPLAASMLGLGLLARSIEDDPDNWTRFVIIAAGETSGQSPAILPPIRPGSRETTGMKSSLLFTVEDRPGSLAAVLACLERGGLNMRKLESRPLRRDHPGHGAWKYAFFVDVECDLTDAAHAAALHALRSATTSLRFLGGYPMGPQLDTATEKDEPCSL